MKVYPLYSRRDAYPGPRRQVKGIVGSSEQPENEQQNHWTVLLNYFDPVSNEWLGGSWTHTGRSDWRQTSCVFTGPPDLQSAGTGPKHLGVFTSHLLVDPWKQRLRFFPGPPEALDDTLVRYSEPAEGGVGDGATGTYLLSKVKFNEGMRNFDENGSVPASEHFDVQHWGMRQSASCESSPEGSLHTRESVPEEPILSDEGPKEEMYHPDSEIDPDLGLGELEFEPFNTDASSDTEIPSYQSLVEAATHRNMFDTQHGEDDTDVIPSDFLDEQGFL
jgi:hypothetical protein